jgi:ribosomal protein S24E
VSAPPAKPEYLMSNNQTPSRKNYKDIIARYIGKRPSEIYLIRHIDTLFRHSLRSGRNLLYKAEALAGLREKFSPVDFSASLRKRTV